MDTRSETMRALRLATTAARCKAPVLSRPLESTHRMASTLVVADHNNASLFPATLSAVTAATKLGGDIDVLVGGAGCGAVAEAAAKIPGVKRVLKSESDCLAKGLAENMEALVLTLQACPLPLAAPNLERRTRLRVSLTFEKCRSQSSVVLMCSGMCWPRAFLLKCQRASDMGRCCTTLQGL